MENLQFGWRFFIATCIVMLLASIPDPRLSRLNDARSEAEEIAAVDFSDRLDRLMGDEKRRLLPIWRSSSLSEEVAIELGETFEVPVWEVERPSRFPTLGELQQSMRRGFDLYSLEESEVRHVFGDVVEEAFDELDGYSEELDEGVEEHGVGGDEIGMVKIMVRSVVRQSEIRHGLWGVRVSFVVVGEHSGVGRVERERTFDSEVEVSPIGVGCMGEGSAPWCGGSFPRLSPFASELANVEIRNLVAHIDFLRQGQLETFEALGVKIRGDVVKIGAPVSMVVMLLFMVAKYRNAKKTLDVLKRSSWIPVMPGKLPVVLSVLGFVGLPFSTLAVNVWYIVYGEGVAGERFAYSVTSGMVLVVGGAVFAYFRRESKGLGHDS